MTERWARVGEHLKNAALYESPEAAPAGEAWKRRLLARRSGEVLVLDAGRPLGLRLLMILLPLVVLALVMVASVWGFYESPAGGEDGPAGWLRLTLQLLDIPLPAIQLWHVVLLGAVVAGITFLVRGRIPDFLPLDW